MTATESIHVTRRAARSPEPRLAIPHTREFLADSLTPLAVYRRLPGSVTVPFR